MSFPSKRSGKIAREKENCWYEIVIGAAAAAAIKRFAVKSNGELEYMQAFNWNIYSLLWLGKGAFSTPAHAHSNKENGQYKHWRNRKEKKRKRTAEKPSSRKNHKKCETTATHTEKEVKMRQPNSASNKREFHGRKTTFSLSPWNDEWGVRSLARVSSIQSTRTHALAHAELGIEEL